LADNVDAVLGVSPHIVASADCGVLDRCGRWFNLAREVVDRRIAEADVIRLGEFAYSP
jgi:hypothetical protein